MYQRVLHARLKTFFFAYNFGRPALPLLHDKVRVLGAIDLMIVVKVRWMNADILSVKLKNIDATQRFFLLKILFLKHAMT